MKPGSLLGLSLLVLVLAPAAARPDQIDDFINAEMQKRRIPGLTLAVTRDGKVVKQKAYGLANIELNVPATPETVYQIASTTKTFTATAVLKLVEEGKLSLDDSVTKWLPEAPAAWSGVTVRHCLTHTSGLPDIVVDPCSLELVADTRKEAIEKLASLPVLAKPGETWSYNQTGYVLLGMILEKISGLRFEEFLEQRFFRPLGMTSTRFGDYKEVVPGRASLYTKLESCSAQTGPKLSDRIYSAQPAYLYNPYMHTGAGINTTAGDLVKVESRAGRGEGAQAGHLERDVVGGPVGGRHGVPFRRHRELCPWLGRRRPARAQGGGPQRRSLHSLLAVPGRQADRHRPDQLPGRRPRLAGAGRGRAVRPGARPAGEMI